MSRTTYITDRYDMNEVEFPPLYPADSKPDFVSTSGTAPQPQLSFDPEQVERHNGAIAEAMIRMANRAGFPPSESALIYLLRIEEAVNNADAIRRWINNALEGHETLSLAAKGRLVEERLAEILAEAA